MSKKPILSASILAIFILSLFCSVFQHEALSGAQPQASRVEDSFSLDHSIPDKTLYDFSTKEQSSPSIMRDQLDALVSHKIEEKDLVRLTEHNPSASFKLLSLAYMLYKKFFFMYSTENKGHVGYRLKLLDSALSSAAFYQSLMYQKDKYSSLLFLLLFKSQLDRSGESTALLSMIVNKAFQEAYAVWANPHFYDEKLTVPLKFLLQAAPAAIYHALKQNPEYEVVTGRKLSDVIAEFSQQGFVCQKQNGIPDEKEILSSASQKEPSFTHNPFYKGAVVAAAERIVFSGAKALEDSLLKGMSTDRLADLENTSLGIVKRGGISRLASQILVPLGLHALSKEVKSTSLENYIPHFSAHNLGMHTDKQEILLQNKSDSSVKQTYKFFVELDAAHFAKKKVIEYLCHSLGGHLIIKMLQNRTTLADNFYKAAAFCAQGFVKIGLLNKNPVEGMYEKACAVRRSFLIKRPGLLSNIIGAGLMLAQYNQPLFTKEEGLELFRMVQDLSYVMARLKKNELHAGLMSPGEQRKYARYIEDRLKNIVDRADAMNVTHKVFSTIFDEMFLAQRAIGRRSVEHLGSTIMMKVGKRIANV